MSYIPNMKRKYPDHFYDQIRMEIAISQIQHDFRKLFPSIPEDQWPKIDQDISEWFLGEKFELEPIHDFWNIVGGFARGLKLKSLLSWVTAKNVIWTLEDVPLSEIQITWDFPGLEFMGKAPYSAKEVFNKLKSREMRERRNSMKEDSDLRSKKYSPRDQFPILLFHDIKGGVINQNPGYYVLEGNRRTVRAILFDKKRIASYVGRFKSTDDKWPEDYWFGTGILRDLIFLAIGYDKEEEKESFDLVRKFYQLVLRDFEVARIATIDRSFKNFERDERLLLDIMLEDLK